MTYSPIPVSNAGVTTTTAAAVQGVTNGIAVTTQITVSNVTVAVKAASTAPVATDPALVVAISPNSVNANGQATMSASAPVAIASNQSSIPVTTLPSATLNGTTSSRINAANTTNATSLKASAGNIINIDVFNTSNSSVYLKFYNKASAPTVGTDTPVWTVPVSNITGFSRSFTNIGKSFSTGIAYAITANQADSDNTAVASSSLTGSIDWI